jgi:iron complex transport system ATP-binding protein
LDRILKPQRGTVFVDGKEITRMKAKEVARKFGYMPQGSQPVFPSTVFDTVLLGRRPHMGFWVTQRDREIVAEALKLMGIENMASRYFDELSGGERQKVLIARVLAQEPEIILLDEPVSNLDIKHQLEVLMLLKNLKQRRSFTVILAIHDLNLASRFSDKIVMLKEGKIFAVGSPDAVLTEENICSVYGVACRVESFDSGRPYVFPLSPVD